MAHKTIFPTTELDSNVKTANLKQHCCLTSLHEANRDIFASMSICAAHANTTHICKCNVHLAALQCLNGHAVDMWCSWHLLACSVQPPCDGQCTHTFLDSAHVEHILLVAKLYSWLFVYGASLTRKSTGFTIAGCCRRATHAIWALLCWCVCLC